MRTTTRTIAATALAAGAVCATSTTAWAGGAPTHPGARPCASGALRPAVTETEGAAGSTYRTITYTNVSHHACAVDGFPGVAFVDRHGHQLGAAATQDGSPGSLVTLAAGGTTSFTVREIHVGLQPGCMDAWSYRPAAALRISPPSGGRSWLVPAGGANACLSHTVRQLYVRAVGSG